jgi:hypothetical protein
MLRLQGFPDTYKIAVSESQTRKQAGNAVPVNVVRALLESLMPVFAKAATKPPRVSLAAARNGRQELYSVLQISLTHSRNA